MISLTFDQRQNAIRKLRAVQHWCEDYATGYLEGMIHGAEGTQDSCWFNSKVEPELRCNGYRAAWRYWNARLQANQSFTRVTNELDPTIPTECCERCKRHNSPGERHLCRSILEGGAA